MEKISLEKYLGKKEEELEKLEKDVSFLRKIQIPLTIQKYHDDSIQLFSEDYSLATNFSIEHRDGHPNISGSSLPDGGSSYYITNFYPQFYFNIKGKKPVEVYIQHKNFEDDERIVFKKISGCNGWGNCSDETRKEEEYADIKKVLSFFEKKGVSKNLINKLEDKIEEIKKY